MTAFFYDPAVFLHGRICILNDLYVKIRTSPPSVCRQRRRRWLEGQPRRHVRASKTRTIDIFRVREFLVRDEAPPTEREDVKRHRRGLWLWLFAWSTVIVVKPAYGKTKMLIEKRCVDCGDKIIYIHSMRFCP